MNITLRSFGNCAILDCKGKLTIGEGDVALRGHILDALKMGFKKIVLNLKDVSIIDSAGLGEIIRSFTTAKKENVEVALLNPSEKVFDLLTLTKLITVLPIYSDEEEAKR
ncbi:MAG: STAS domain-containing protein [Thermoanaerobaculia bacterium]